MRIMNGDRGQELTLCAATALRALQLHGQTIGKRTSKSSSQKCHASWTANKKRTGLAIKAALEEQKKEKLSKQERKKEEEEERRVC